MLELLRSGRAIEVAVAILLTALAIALVLARFGDAPRESQHDRPVAAARPAAGSGQ